MKTELRNYFAKIGSKGGSKSKRVLTPEQAREMQERSVAAKQRKAGKGTSVSRPRKRSDGSVKSKSFLAARENAKKGGRPRKKWKK